MGLRVDRTEMWTELLQASRFLCMWGGAFLEDDRIPGLQVCFSLWGGGLRSSSL